IDLTNCYPVPAVPGVTPDPYNGATKLGPWSLTGNIDILFNSSGLVANATTGQLIIPVRHVDRPNDVVFVVVYTRTGKVTAVPPSRICPCPRLPAPPSAPPAGGPPGLRPRRPRPGPLPSPSGTTPATPGRPAMTRSPRRAGVTLMEVMIATAILAIGTLAIM